MSAYDQLEDVKLQELAEAVTTLLTNRDMGRFDDETIALLIEMRDIVHAWVTHRSSLTHDQMIAAISRLTGAVTGKTVIVDVGGRVLH